MTKIAPQLLGIAALGVLLVVGIRSEPAPEVLASPFQAAVSRLRIGMTAEETRLALMIPAGLKPARPVHRTRSRPFTMTVNVERR